MAVARSYSCRVTKSQGEWAVLGVFFPTDNALYSIAFGTRTNTAEGCNDPRRRSGIFGDNVRDKPKHPMNCELDLSMQRRAHDRGRHLIAGVGGVYYRPRRGDCAPKAKSNIYDCLAIILNESVIS